MGFADAIRTCLQKYVTFSGRATRAEFWWFWLFVTLATTAGSLIDKFVFGVPGGDGWVSGLAGLALFLPSISVAVRRLHDIGRSGWWWWLALIPFVGWIVLLVWHCQPSAPGANRFGPDPFGREVVRPMAPAGDLSAMASPLPQVPRRAEEPPPVPPAPGDRPGQ